MAHLVTIDSSQELPEKIYINKGDVLLFKATGGHQLSGSGVIQFIGIFTESFLLPSGEKIYPEGSPNMVLFKALKEGEALLSIVFSGSLSDPKSKSYLVTIKP
jgi:hypothetical protein